MMRHLPGLEAMVSLPLLVSGKHPGSCPLNFSLSDKHTINASKAGIYFVVNRCDCRRRLCDSNHSMGVRVTQANHFARAAGTFNPPVARAYDSAGDYVRLSPHGPQAQAASHSHRGYSSIFDHFIFCSCHYSQFPN